MRYSKFPDICFYINSFFIVAICLLPNLGGMYSQSLSLNSVFPIWEEAPHNGFPLMIYFNDYCYVSFREGNAHGGDPGKIRVIRSIDLINWESVLLIEDENGFDLREGHFSILPNGNLHLSYTGFNLDGPPFLLNTYLISSSDGMNWSEPTLLPYHNYWLYGLTWHNNTGYGLADIWGDQWSYFLLKTEDGVNFSIADTLSFSGNQIELLSGATEADILFDNNGHLWAAIRSESDSPLVLADASPPLYTNWRIRAMESEGDHNPSLGRPELIRLPDGTVILGTRVSGNLTGLYYLDLDSATTSIALILPSGGDTGYIDMVLRNQEMQAVYYSTHEDTITRIYFAHIDYDIQTANIEIDSPNPYKLNQNYPNPFNSSTNISYSLPKQSFVTITIHDTYGKQIAKLLDAKQDAGNKSVEWNAKDDSGRSVGSGMYFYNIRAGKFFQTKKMMLLK